MTEQKQEYAIEVHRPALVNTFDEAARAAQAMAQSGYFADAKQTAQAMVKILAGHEMGFDTFASMTGIHIIKGKPVVGANLMAAAVKQHPKYDYRVKAMEDSHVCIAFYQGQTHLGDAEFTIADAKTAGLTGRDNWRNYPRNMLFARAISNGVRWYCPDVFAGNAVYTPDELDDEAGAPDWDVVDGEIAEQAPKPVEEMEPEGPEAEESEGEPEPAKEKEERKPPVATTRTGRQEYWATYHNGGPKDAGVAQKHANNIAKKYGDGEDDWSKAISKLHDAMIAAKEKQQELEL